MPTSERYQKHDRQGPSCSCAACVACAGLDCLDRPRYFTGQLLTEADLSSEQSYMLAKNRLHNRYLHGWGVVCGLQVACHACEGWVTLGQGYAIDPCGNDIIVCAEREFDLIGQIRACRDQQRRRDRCDPPRAPARASSQDVEETWCITIAYDEQEARPITALRRDAGARASCGCGGKGCSCGSGKGTGCGCGNGARAATAAPRVQSGVGRASAPCEPTRIFEGYRLDVSRAEPGACGDLTGRWGTSPPGWTAQGTLGRGLAASDILLGNLLGRGRFGLLGDLADLAAPDSLLGKLLACLQNVIQFIGGRMPLRSWQALGPMTFEPTDIFTPISSPLDTDIFSPIASPPDNIPTDGFRVKADAQHDAFCRLHQAVRALFVENPLNTRCELAEVLDKIDCRPPHPGESDRAYLLEVRAPLYRLYGLVLQYMLDCFCQSLMPPCPPDPQDDRLVLACVVVKGDEIVRICNFSCRRYAGSFPALEYWLSLVPVIPLLRSLVEQLCCMPELNGARSPLLGGLLQLAAGDFALPRVYVRNILALLDKLDPANLFKGVNLATLVGQDLDSARTTLSNANVIAVEREVASADEVPALKTMTSSPFVASGERVVIYRTSTQVVGYGRYDELAELREQMNKLRQELDRLSSPPR